MAFSTFSALSEFFCFRFPHIFGAALGRLLYSFDVNCTNQGVVTICLMYTGSSAMLINIDICYKKYHKPYFVLMLSRMLYSVMSLKRTKLKLENL